MGVRNAATSTKVLLKLGVKTGMNNNIEMVMITKHNVAPKPKLSTFNSLDLKIEKMPGLSMVSMATRWRSWKTDQERQYSLKSRGPPPHQLPAVVFRQPAIKV